MKRIALLLAAALWSAPLLAEPRGDALATFEKFFEYFRTDNHDQLVSLFSPEALFIGTISPELVTQPEGLRAYFVRALSGERGEVRARIFSTTATQVTDEVVLVTAAWQSERTLGGLMSTNGPSRNTSVMHKRGDRWFIVQFHNSWKPK
jgi:hypothetical protein